MFKYTIPRIFHLLFPNLIWELPQAENTVYITFDDGPHPQVTPWVLETLERFNAKATFFCVGENVVKFRSTFEKIEKSGHSVGNHSFNHLNGWKTDDKSYFENISKCTEVVKSGLFRPPYGRIRLSQVKELKKDYRIVMWSILSRDYDKNLNSKESIIAIKKNLRNGSIIVFHDSNKTEKNLKIILPEILNYLKENNFLMKSL